MDMAAALKAASSISRFVESQAFTQALGETGLEAAHDVMSTAQRSKDYAATVRSAANHLEFSAAEIRAALEKGLRTFPLRAARQIHLLAKYEYVQCLRATCYRYLNEDGLCDAALDDAEQATRTYLPKGLEGDTWNEVPKIMLYAMGILLNPVTYVDAGTLRSPSVHVPSYRRELDTKPLI